MFIYIALYCTCIHQCKSNKYKTQLYSGKRSNCIVLEFVSSDLQVPLHAQKHSIIFHGWSTYALACESMLMQHKWTKLWYWLGQFCFGLLSLGFLSGFYLQLTSIYVYLPSKTYTMRKEVGPLTGVYVYTHSSVFIKFN